LRGNNGGEKGTEVEYRKEGRREREVVEGRMKV